MFCATVWDRCGPPRQLLHRARSTIDIPTQKHFLNGSTSGLPLVDRISNFTDGHPLRSIAVILVGVSFPPPSVCFSFHSPFLILHTRIVPLRVCVRIRRLGGGRTTLDTLLNAFSLNVNSRQGTGEGTPSYHPPGPATSPPTRIYTTKFERHHFGLH